MTNTLQVLMITMTMVIGLFITVGLLINFSRNFFTRSRYIRIVTYNDDKTIDVKHFKKSNFNKDRAYVVNPNHIFILKGYTTMTFTQHTKENINPLDFESKYDAHIYESAINSNLITQAFNTLKPNKLDLLQVVMIVSLMTLALVGYMILKQTGVM